MEMKKLSLVGAHEIDACQVVVRWSNDVGWSFPTQLFLRARRHLAVLQRKTKVPRLIDLREGESDAKLIKPLTLPQPANIPESCTALDGNSRPRVHFMGMECPPKRVTTSHGTTGNRL